MERKTPPKDVNIAYIKHNRGLFLGFMKKAIAFAELVRYEVETGAAFPLVMQMRPDAVYPRLVHTAGPSEHGGSGGGIGRHGFFDRLRHMLPDVSVLDNDLFAVLPRAHAPSYFLNLAFDRAVRASHTCMLVARRRPHQTHTLCHNTTEYGVHVAHRTPLRVCCPSL